MKKNKEKRRNWDAIIDNTLNCLITFVPAAVIFMVSLDVETIIGLIILSPLLIVINHILNKKMGV